MKTIWLGSNILINILTWKQYINLKTVGIVARLNQTLRIIEYPPESKLFIKLYFPLVLVVWGQAAKTHANSNYFCCKGVPFVWFTLAIIQLTRFHFLRPLSMLYFKSVAILMQGITNNLAPHNILRGLFNTTRIHAYVYNYTRSSSRGDYEIKFSRLDKQGNHFQDWGPQYGIAYLRILEKSQSTPLKRKYMIVYLKSVLSQTDDYPDLPTLSY